MEISEAFKEISVAPSTEYEEHFISDYEAPFRIGEYESITKLNEIAEHMVDVETPEKHGTASYKYYDAGEVITFADSLEGASLISDAMEHVGDIISTEQLDEMVEHEAQSGGWRRVKYFLSGIDSMTDDYYYLNGYANAETLRRGTLDNIVADLMDGVKHSIGI